MKKLSKEQLRRKAELVRDLQDTFDEYESAVNKAEEFRQEIYDQMEEFFSDKSEKWQEGDAGQEYSSWMDEWEESLELDEGGKSDTLDGLRDALDG